MKKFALVVLSAVLITQPGHGQNLTIDQAALEFCFSKPSRVNRLACYDDLFKNPNIEMPKVSVPERRVRPTLSGTAKSVLFARERLAAQLKTPTGVSVSVINRKTGEAGPIPGVSSHSVLRRLSLAATDQDFQDVYDIYLAISSIDGAGENGILLISCENNISHLRIQWDRLFEPIFVNTRIRLENKLGKKSDAISQRMRVLGDGHYLVAPRGLESIRILSKLVSGEKFQVSTDDQQNMRSIFFDAAALRGGLSIIARHCSWSVQSFGREF